MAFAPMIIMAVGAAMSAAAAMQQAKAASDAADRNAEIAGQNATIARQQGVAAVDAQARAQRQQLGKMQANYGASGVDVGAGSPLDVLSDSASQATLDNLTTKYNYDLRARGYQNDQYADVAAADNAIKQGQMNATSALIKGAGSMYGASSGGASSGAGTPIPMINSLGQT